jgi:hypothetical protein
MTTIAIKLCMHHLAVPRCQGPRHTRTLWLLHADRSGDEASRPARVITVHFLLTLPSREGNLVCVDDNDEIPKVLSSVIDGLVLSHDDLDDLGRKLACNLTLCIHIPPPPEGRIAFNARMATVQHSAYDRRWYCALPAGTVRRDTTKQTSDQGSEQDGVC